jgi:protoporphyrinogen oxidase
MVATVDRPVVVIGAGPAGLTAAYDLTERGVPTIVFEGDTQVGGLARTVVYKGFRFDIGGHRFFTKVPAVRALWHELLAGDLLTRPRLSRIYYGGRFYDYPLKAGNVLRNLGVATSIAVVASYARARVAPVHPEHNFEDWIVNRFGRRLFEMFFKTYTEKVWGMPCREIGAQWAAQRIRGLSLWTAALGMLRGSDRTIKTLIQEFEYPRLGPGMMWETCRDRIVERGGRIEFGARVVGVQHDGDRIAAVVVDRNGERFSQPAAHVISTMAIRQLVEAMQPSAPAKVAQCGRTLKYRDFLTVALIVDRADLFPDNWIYVHEPTVRVGRIQNFKNWSAEMVPDPALTCLGLEYFCGEGDDLWRMRDDGLIALAEQELRSIRMIDRSVRVVDACVQRVRKAYPVYDEGYEQALDGVRAWTDRFANLQLVGRNGMHKYNNQDHSMLTARLAVRNLFGERHDLWAVNAEEDYHEEETLRALAASQPLVPRRIAR